MHTKLNNSQMYFRDIPIDYCLDIQQLGLQIDAEGCKSNA